MPTQPPPPPNPYAKPSQPYGAPLGPPPSSPPRPAAPARKQPGRRKFVAGVLAAALVVGGGAGIGGAAAYDALNGDDPSAGAGAGQLDGQDREHRRRPAVADPRTGASRRSPRRCCPRSSRSTSPGPQGSGSGSGIILSEDGQILTNNHVVEVADGRRHAERLLQRRHDGRGHRARHRLPHRHRGHPGHGRLRPHAGHHRLVRRAQGRPGRRRDRLAVRPRVDGHQRHRQRAGPAGQRRPRRRGQLHDVPGDPDRRRRSTPATAAARSLDLDGNVVGHQLLDPHRLRRAATARSASASPSPSTRSCRSSSRWRTARRRRTPSSASRVSDVRGERRATVAQPGAQIGEVTAGSTAGAGRASRPATS